MLRSKISSSLFGRADSGIFVGFSLKVSFDTARHVHVLAKYISYDEFNLVRPLVFFLCY